MNKRQTVKRYEKKYPGIFDKRYQFWEHPIRFQMTWKVKTKKEKYDALMKQFRAQDHTVGLYIYDKETGDSIEIWNSWGKCYYKFVEAS